MTSKFNPATLSLQTGSSFTPPSSINFDKIKRLDAYLKIHVPIIYKGRVGRVFYFEFKNTWERDTFLRKLEELVISYGNPVQRITH